MLKKHYILIFIFIAYLFAGPQSIAIVSKTKGNVKYKNKNHINQFDKLFGKILLSFINIFIIHICIHF